MKNSVRDCSIYILFLTSLVILWGTLDSYGFMVRGKMFSYSFFVFPFLTFLVHDMDWRYHYQSASKAIALSTIFYICFYVITTFALGEVISLAKISSLFIGYMISQFLNLFLYEFLMKNTRFQPILIYFNYLIVFLVYYFIYIIINISDIHMEEFWILYFFPFIIQLILSVPFTLLDKSIIKKRY